MWWKLNLGTKRLGCCCCSNVMKIESCWHQKDPKAYINVETYSSHWEQPAKLLHSFWLHFQTFWGGCHLPTKYNHYNCTEKIQRHIVQMIDVWMFRCIDQTINNKKGTAITHKIYLCEFHGIGMHRCYIASPFFQLTVRNKVCAVLVRCYCVWFYKTMG
jgi:hypothetical protein